MYGRGRYQASGLPSPTPAVLHIMVINAVLWLLTAGDVLANERLALSAESFQIWQIFTYMWVHADLFHMLSNMLGLYFLGIEVERAFGTWRFLRFYMLCGVGAGVVIWLSDLAFASRAPQDLPAALFASHVTLGASGAVFGVITAFSLLWPDRKLMLIFPPIPIKAAWMIPLLFGLQLMMGGNISHWGHLGGVITALILLRKTFAPRFSGQSLRYRWNRYRSRNRLRAMHRDEWQRRQARGNDD